MEEKKTLNWSKRGEHLRLLLEKHRNKGPYDCVVAVSGGKDGSYVAHTLKKRFGIKPLCITVRPPLSMKIGDKNLKAFIHSGYDHIHISPDFEAMRKLDRIGLVRYGQGYYGWLISIHTAVLRIAEKFDISLVFYSEDGEIEYGGSSEGKNIGIYGTDYMKKLYLNSTYEGVMSEAKLSDREAYWFTFPEEIEKKSLDIDVAHFSFFENWDPYRNYLVAKEFCGLLENEEGAVGTFTNFAQNDQELASLHYYLMFLKFGFGRATQDAGIEIRRNALSREQAKSLVKLYDGSAPIGNYEIYCQYFDMSPVQFENTINQFVNKDLFHKVDGEWRLINPAL